ncbi:MAG: hypothetical protein IPG04_42660 [Polyangiaceae bacterium]|jgi:hypothetical protein|nr:hypothetical protein [Polyangiaceae bacterium]
MKVSRLAIRGVASLPDLDRDFVSAATGRPHDLIVISGPPASGKTRLCELMLAVLETVGPYQGIVRAADWYADPTRGARVELDLWLGEGEAPSASGSAPASSTARTVVHFSASGTTSEVDRAVARRLSRYDHDPAHGKREYFPEDRQRAWGAREDGLGAPEQSLMRCSRDPQKYSFVPRFLAQLRTDPAQSRAFADRLELLSPTIRYTPATRGGDPTACFKHRDRIGVRYAELSSSEADAALIAATAVMIGLNHSIVLLDRPELYVPPDRLASWVHGLAGLGEGNQWIVATSVDSLVASVDRSQRVFLGQSEDPEASAARSAGRPS